MVQSRRQAYIFFSEHLLVAASHMPPAFSQSAALVAFVTSPAKAGAVKPSARANANMETNVFITFSPLRLYSGGLVERRFVVFVPEIKQRVRHPNAATKPRIVMLRRPSVECYPACQRWFVQRGEQP